MNAMKSMVLAAAIALPAAVAAGPGGHGGGMGGHGGGMSMGNVAPASMDRAAPSSEHQSMGSTNGTGWNHMNSPKHETGQAFFECEGARPGHASSAPGSAFNPDGNAGTHYAGEQPQNSRNTSSVSQYDTACMHQR